MEAGCRQTKQSISIITVLVCVSEKEEIPYSTVFVRSCEPITKADLDWAEASLKKNVAVAA